MQFCSEYSDIDTLTNSEIPDVERYQQHETLINRGERPMEVQIIFKWIQYARTYYQRHSICNAIYTRATVSEAYRWKARCSSPLKFQIGIERRFSKCFKRYANISVLRGIRPDTQIIVITQSYGKRTPSFANVSLLMYNPFR